MRAPKQAPSVNRSIAHRSQQAAAAGAVAPSGFLDILGKAAKGALSGVMG